MTVVYIVTVVISVIVALILVQVSKLSAQAAAENERRRMLQELSPSGDLKAMPLSQGFYKDIGEAVGSLRMSQEINAKLSSVVGTEVNKRVHLYTQELNKKYESVLKEKTHNEEVAWKKYNKVVEDKKNTEAVIRSVAEGLVVVDAQGKVVMMNPAAEKLLGVSKKDKIGKSIYSDLKEEQLITFAKDSPDKQGKEIELISPHDETKKTLRASTAVLENENGQTVGMVSVLSDITKQKALDQMKTNFVASVSHELRTPLVAIDKSLSLILDGAAGAVSETQEKFLTIAERNLKRLNILVNDLLDLSKLEAGKVELKVKASSVPELINDSVETLNTWAQTKSVTINTKTDEGLPQLNVDPDRINQVLNNLIGNAIKFTPQGGNIAVEAKLSSDGNAVEISVEDNGIGISPEDLPKVFDKFYQSGERVSTDINGTGIGLAIAKEIVTLHGGKIWAESEKDKGAKFTFTLPV
ncbi:MAG TPA: ATP-binding protein [Candidatus Margulisiibacteriota bacterium]|nr:ATP-binding protein [Candidatus Margulisiibacteriota bacterium]